MAVPRSVQLTAGRQIRSSINAVREDVEQNGRPADPGTPLGEWIDWAKRQAERLDPLKESPAFILDREDETAIPEWTTDGWKWPERPFQFPKPIWMIGSNAGDDPDGAAD